MADGVLNGQGALRNAVFSPVTAVAGPSSPPVLVNTITNSGFGAVGSGAQSFTVLAGANRALVVAINIGNSGGTVPSITSVTWEATTTNALTAIPGATSKDTNFCSTTLYGMVAPEVFTSGNIRVTLGSSPSTCWQVNCSSYTNAAQSGTFGTAVTGGQINSTTVTVTGTVGTGQLGYTSTCTDANSALTIGGTASPTQKIQSPLISGDVTTAVGESSVTGTITWTWAGADNGGAIVFVPINGI